MGNSRKRTNRKKIQKVSSLRNLVNIESVYGSANFGEHHDKSSVHLQTAVRPAQLPPDDSDFLGRDEHLRDLCKALQGTEGSVRSVAISGQPGVGKTTLAIRLSHDLVSHFPDGQIFIKLGDADADGPVPSRALESILRAFGFSGDEIANSFEDKVAQYRTALSTRHCLVVLDNAVSESQVRPLLPGMGKSAVIITSRKKLAGLIGVRPVHLSNLTASEGVALLKRIVGSERVEAELSECNQLAALCGGLPLALRIAANKLRDRSNWTFSYYVDLLLDERNRLQMLQAGDLEIRASFSLSYNSLDEVDKLTFRRLGICVSEGFSLASASALCGDEVDPLAALDRLVEANLVEPSSSPDRYRMHDLLRAYARERLEADEGTESIKACLSRLLNWYILVASHADGHIYEGDVRACECNFFETLQDAIDWLELEHSALVSLAAEAYRHDLYEAVVDIASYMKRFFDRRLHAAAWRQMSEHALLAARRTGEKKLLIDALTGLVRVSTKFPIDSDRPISWLDEALALARDIGSPRYESKVLAKLGEVLSRGGREEAALGILRRSVELARSASAVHEEGNARLALAEVELHLERYDASKDTYNKARLCFVAQRDKHCQGRAFVGLASLNSEIDLYDEELACLRQAIRFFKMVQDEHCLSGVFTQRADAYARLGRFPEAIEDYRAADQLLRQLSDSVCLAPMLDHWGWLEFHAGNYEEAASRLSEACSLWEQSGNRALFAQGLLGLSIATEKSQSTEAAHILLQRAIDIAEVFGYAWLPVAKRALESGAVPPIGSPFYKSLSAVRLDRAE
ncbi:NB-ARC domain-containing protein [Nonomuraea sp. NPDC048882]|uniref:ATP-binding protein n=1 Tax=Nonomuraea sp. NPDC048882 TaxID=3154347 RepID=UPI0033D2B997